MSGKESQKISLLHLIVNLLYAKNNFPAGTDYRPHTKNKRWMVAWEGRTSWWVFASIGWFS